MWANSLLVIVVLTTLFIPGILSLLCACNTAACQDQGQTTCNATAMCYVQYLDLGDGNDPLIRGCIASKTPLLCENRRPALALSSGWPVLVCCAHAPMCNKDTVPGNLPTTPQRMSPTPDAQQVITGSPSDPVPNSVLVQPNSKSSESISRHQQSLHPEDVGAGVAPSPQQPESGGAGLSATYSALLAVACSLLVLVAGALALFLLRKRALGMASGHYGAMHGGYLKGQAPRDCTDPEAPHSGLYGKRVAPAVAS